jgi:hypothetical protein
MAVYAPVEYLKSTNGEERVREVFSLFLGVHTQESPKRLQI